MRRLNKNFVWIVLALLCSMGAASCRSKQAVLPTAEPVVVAAPKENGWSTMSVPVSIDVEQPMSLAMSGHMVMERNKRVYLSMRVFGFEVAQLNLTPTTAVALVKQGDRMVVEAPIETLMAMHDVSFSTLQEALLGNQEAINALPKGLNIAQVGHPDRPSIRVYLKAGKSQLDMTLTPDLARAKWHGVTLAPFNPNLDGYRRVTLPDLLKFTK